MPMPAVKWKVKEMSRKEHQEYISQVKEAVKDLDFAMRCYYISLGDDFAHSEEKRTAFLKHAFEEGLKEVGITERTVAVFNGN